MARLSRRAVVAALGSAPLLAGGKFTPAAAADPVLVLCAHYAELARRQELLMRQWGDREAWLGDNRDWFKLSKAEQRALPEAQLLYAIDEDYDRCVRAGVCSILWSGSWCRRQQWHRCAGPSSQGPGYWFW